VNGVASPLILAIGHRLLVIRAERHLSSVICHALRYRLLAIGPARSAQTVGILK
jgi:hypothetical protein